MTDVWAVIRYDSRATGRKEDLVAVFSSVEKAREFIRASEEADENDFDIEQHTLDEPDLSAP